MAGRAEEAGDEHGADSVGREQHPALVRTIDENSGERPDRERWNGNRDEHARDRQRCPWLSVREHCSNPDDQRRVEDLIAKEGKALRRPEQAPCPG